MSYSEFYDEYLITQVKSGVNDRIWRLYKRVCKIGISSSSNVLEIGCGIGALTFLLSKKIKSGKIEAIDISEKSIDYASKNFGKPNIEFIASNVLDYVPKLDSFHIITLFDVLEHIPLQDHENVFSRLKSWMNPDSLLLINIPNPKYILYDQLNNPEVLQELDQPIYISDILSCAQANDLELRYFETYSIWVKDDYQFLIFKKAEAFNEELVSKAKNILKRVFHSFERRFRKIRFKMPST